MTNGGPSQDSPDPRTVLRAASGEGSSLPPTSGPAPRTGLGATSAGSDPPADAIPGYEILGELGRGGMGVVYRARDTRLNREVALKMILRSGAAPTTVARFWAEAEVMAAVQHPNVVRVYELGGHDGRPFMAMEFVSGGSLSGLLERGRLSPTEAAELMADVAAGVAAAHEQGVVHRDLKPDNVLLDGDTPKIADFGIAKRRAHDLTQTNALMGTPAYMAPEQVAAKAKFVGPPADVWSLGVTLYECLSGKRPFVGDTVWVIFEKIAGERPPPLSALVRRVPRDLQTIVDKCLAKEPERRYETARELSDDLTRFANGEPIRARPVGPAERLARWVRRKPTAAAAYALSALAVLLAAAVFVVLGFWRAAEGARDTAEKANASFEAARDEALVQKRLADAGRTEADRLRGAADTARAAAVKLQGVAEKAQAAESLLRKKVEVFEYGRTVQVALQRYRDNDVIGARELLAGTQAPLRGWEWHYVNRLCNASLVTYGGRDDGLLAATFSPSGARVVSMASGRVCVWDAATGAEVSVLRVVGGQALAVHPDGVRVAVAVYPSVKMWDVRTGTEVLALKKPAGGVVSLAFSPDGTRLATANGDRAVMWDATTGAELVSLKLPDRAQVRTVAFGPGGTRVIGASLDQARVWDTATGVEVLALKHDGISAAAFSPDGTRAVTAGTGGARVWDTKTGAELLALKGHTEGRSETVYSVVFSPDGARIATGGTDMIVRVWDAKTGTESLVLRGHTSHVTSVAFSPDGARLATVGRFAEARVWDLGAGPSPAGHTGHVWAAAFAPDGTQFVTADDQEARVWDARTGAMTRRFEQRGIRSLAFSPDGTRLVTGGAAPRVWDAKTGAMLRVLNGHTKPVFAAALNRNGTRAVTAGDDGTIRVWDATSGTALFVIKGPPHSQMRWATFSPDGARFVTAGIHDAVRVWDAATGAELLALGSHKSHMQWAVFSPDGGRILATNERGVGVWDARTGAELLAFEAYDGLLGQALSPDGARIVTLCGNRTMKVWDAATGAELLSLREPDPLSTVAFSPDGRQIVTADFRGRVRIWDATPPAPRPVGR